MSDLPIFSIPPAPFWMVWSESGGAPTVKHKTEQEAMNEACRLAEKHRTRRFYILRSVSHVEDVVVKTALVKTVHEVKP